MSVNFRWSGLVRELSGLCIGEPTLAHCRTSSRRGQRYGEVFLQLGSGWLSSRLWRATTVSARLETEKLCRLLFIAIRMDRNRTTSEYTFTEAHTERRLYIYIYTRPVHLGSTVRKCTQNAPKMHSSIGTDEGKILCALPMLSTKEGSTKTRKFVCNLMYNNE